MKKILLTGGKGFFASRFAEFYKNQYEIFAPGHHTLDVTDETLVEKAVVDFQPDIILHTAAVASTDYCNAHPEIAHRINVEGSVFLARAAKRVGAKMIFVSSEQLFNGNEESGPYKEEDKAVPNTVYGQTKLEAEERLKKILPELWIVRFTWLFGLPQRGCGMSSNLLWNTVQSILANQPILASKHEFRGMTDVDEMIQNLPKIFALPYGTYHLGAENNKSRYEIVQEIIEAIGLTKRLPELLVENKEQYAKSPRDVRINTAKAQASGIVFSDTSTAIKKYLEEYKFTC